MKTFSLYLMSRKGYIVIRDLIYNGFSSLIDKVVIARDPNMQKDYYEEILSECQNAHLSVCNKNDTYTIESPYVIAISWRWMVPLSENSKLIVFHDSLLPKYRGFAPLVNMLVNHEPYVGVTALYASDEYDKGEIISQRKVAVPYPIKITDAIDLVTPLYSEIVSDIFKKISNNEDLPGMPQIEEDSSYSLWRDEEDYRIDWNRSATEIQQFIYSVGFPFKGASSYIEGTRIRILEAEVLQDVRIENRTCGKVIFMKKGDPVVVCGDGLLRLKELWNDDCTEKIKCKRFRIKFL